MAQSGTQDGGELQDPLAPASSGAPSGESGLTVSSLAPGERVVFSTHNSAYRVIMLNPALQIVIIRGGRHFPVPTEATLVGSSDGDLRQRDWIALGRRLEVEVENRLFVTSSIVNIERDAGKPASPR